MRARVRTTTLRTTALLLLLPGAALAQERLDCDDGEWGDRERHCEVRELRLSPRASLAVDGGLNGGVQIRGWDRDEIHVQAKVTGWADDAAEARALADAVSIESDGTLRARGPEMRRRASWAVSYLVHVPRRIDLELQTHNGGIAVYGVEGRIAFEALNGGIRLREVAGDVTGRTTNGGLDIRLDGERWRGAGLDVRTTNGGIRLSIPARYSARLETGTVNGGMDIEFPVTVQGRIGRRLETVLGEGGPTIRLLTTNGGVRVSRQ